MSSGSDDVNVVDDLINTFKKNDLFEYYEDLLNNINDFDYERKFINGPAAFGDCYKFTVNYSFSKNSINFKFQYTQLISDNELSCGRFELDDKTIFGTNLLGQTVFDSDTMSDFKKQFEFDDENLYHFFNILNSFTLGTCLGIENNEISIVVLEEMIIL